MAAEDETSAKQEVSIEPGASSPAKSATSTAVINANCVSTSSVTSRAAAAKGTAKVQSETSFVGACVDCEAMDSASAKPTRMSSRPQSTEMPTRAKARRGGSGSGGEVLRDGRAAGWGRVEI